MISMVNLAICLGIVWACICRLNSDICQRYRLARTRYALLLGGAAVSGLQPLLFSTWPSMACVIFNATVLAGLVLNVVRWYAPEIKEAP